MASILWDPRPGGLIRSSRGCFSSRSHHRRRRHPSGIHPDHSNDPFAQVPGVGLLLGVQQPDSTWFGTRDEFGAEGLKLEPLEPMRRWRITFNGQMKYDAVTPSTATGAKCAGRNKSLPFMLLRQEVRDGPAGGRANQRILEQQTGAL